MPFYAVAKGKTTGIFNTWDSCKQQTIGFKGAIYKKFETKEQAEKFIEKNTIDETSIAAPVDYYVYTDGACSKNGKLNAAAGIGIFFGQNDPRNVSKRIAGKQTNNTAELSAVVEAYNIIEEDISAGKQIVIVTDSIYAIRCATTYGEKMKLSGYKNAKGEPIPNRELVKKAHELYENKDNVRFLHCLAHTLKKDAHSIGNKWADKLATDATRISS